MFTSKMFVEIYPNFRLKLETRISESFSTECLDWECVLSFLFTLHAVVFLARICSLLDWQILCNENNSSCFASAYILSFGSKYAYMILRVTLARKINKQKNSKSKRIILIIINLRLNKFSILFTLLWIMCDWLVAYTITKYLLVCSIRSI